MALGPALLLKEGSLKIVLLLLGIVLNLKSIPISHITHSYSCCLMLVQHANGQSHSTKFKTEKNCASAGK